MGLLSLTDDRPDTDVTFETVLDILKNKRRRLVLSAIVDDGARELSAVTRIVAAVEYDQPAEQLTHDQRKRVYVSLYQTHIPKLADADLIEHNESAGTVRPTAHAADLLAVAQEIEDMTGSGQ